MPAPATPEFLLLQQALDTVLDFATEPPIAVDLRRPVKANEVVDLGVGAEFGVVTAWNPESRKTPLEINQAEDQRLRDRLTGMGYTPIRATGRSTDSMHAEPGWAVPASLPELLELAREFSQTAVFWFDGTSFWLWPVKGEPVKLPSEGREAGQVRSSTPP